MYNRPVDLAKKFVKMYNVHYGTFRVHLYCVHDCTCTVYMKAPVAVTMYTMAMATVSSTQWHLYHFHNGTCILYTMYIMAPVEYTVYTMSPILCTRLHLYRTYDGTCSVYTVHNGTCTVYMMAPV